MARKTKRNHRDNKAKKKPRGTATVKLKPAPKSSWSLLPKIKFG